jgi:hypothetical protein
MADAIEGNAIFGNQPAICERATQAWSLDSASRSTGAAASRARARKTAVTALAAGEW